MITTAQTKRPKALHVALWIAQIVLGTMFLLAGYMKFFLPMDQVAAMIPWAKEAPLLIRFLGLSELAGGVGVILPAALRIKPHLTWWAATALAMVMVLAVFFHLLRGEFAAIGTNIFLFLLATFIAWGRFKKAPIYSKA